MPKKPLSEVSLLPAKSSGDVRVVVAYPNTYRVGMSNLGFQTVYRLFAEEPRTRVERAFSENSKRLCESPPSVFTIETSTALSAATVLALSVSFEADYPRVLELIAEGGKSLFECAEDPRRRIPRSTRGQRRPFVLGGGAALTLNPEPLARFFDAILIGEAEEAVPQMMPLFISWHDGKLAWDELLLALSRIEGVYVPSFFEANYSELGVLLGYSPTIDGLPFPSRRVLKDLDSSPTHSVFLSEDTEFRSMHLVETGRGCETGCRFCVSAYMYRPVRKRSRESIQRSVEIGRAWSSRLGFVGAAVSSHPGLRELLLEAAEQGKQASVSSLMSNRVESSLVDALKGCGVRAVALAPEAGTEGLRFRVGKRVSDRDIIAAAALLSLGEILTLKLYFMIGLPGETEDDVQGIAALTAKICEAFTSPLGASGGSRRVSLSINPFIPKPWTPFQKEPLLGAAELRRRLKVIRQGIRGCRNVELKTESLHASFFQTLLSRGDRRVGDLLLHLKTKDEDWRSLVKNSSKSLLEGVPPADYFVTRRFGDDEFFPWEVLDFHIKRELLEREAKRAAT